MAKAPKKTETPDTVLIEPVQMRSATFFLRGATPLLLNRMSEKVKRDLLYPSGKKNAAEKLITMKHEPYTEYRSSVYRSPKDDAETRLIFPGGAFKKAIASAALDIPGAAKAVIGRLVSVKQQNIPIYGAPQMHAAVVRMADQKRTPDIRFRAILPEWCCKIEVTYASLISFENVSNLLGAAGQIVGVGDGRTEKGSLDHGQFFIVDYDDDEWELISKQGREAQDSALQTPEFYDEECRDLVTWFYEEKKRRQSAPDPQPKKRAKKSDPMVVDNDQLARDLAALTSGSNPNGSGSPNRK